MPRQLIVFRDASYIDSNRINLDSIDSDYQLLTVPDAILDVDAFVFFSIPHLACNPNIQQSLTKELSELIQ